MSRPLYKRIYHNTIKPLFNILTLRYVRKKIKQVQYKIKQVQYEKVLYTKILTKVQKIEQDFTENTVLIFQHQFYDFMGKQCYNGGAERYVQDLADILYANKYQPILVQMSNNGLWHKKIKHLSIIGIPSENIDQYQKVLQLFSKYKFVIYSGAVDWGKKLHPNILISHGITWDTTDTDVDSLKIANIFRDVDKFVSVDTNTISWLRTTFSKTLNGLDANYIPNYVDTKKYFPIKRKKDNKIHITFPRRASPERGYWLMSAALPPILDKYPDVVFQFVGFAHGAEIQHDILDLEKKYPGRVSHCMVEPHEMPKIYQNTDISLIPTIYAEGTSLSCLEAQACGNIVISTNVGGLPNLVLDGYNGLLINPTGQDLMKALDRVLEDKKLQKRLSQNAVSVASAFDKSIWIKKWEYIIKKGHKKNVLIISSNFTGGGLETRINNIINLFHDKYSFSLITKTAPENMKTKPSKYIEHIYSWDEYKKALQGTDILDVHPFGASKIIKTWDVSPQIKKIYTLHGELSLTEKLDFLHDYNRIYTVSNLLKPYIKKFYPGLKDKLILSKNMDVITKYKTGPKGEKNILFSITNINDKDFIQDIINIIPQQYTIHIIGMFQENSLVRSKGKIIFHGFVNIQELFKQYHFDMAFSRGGFATMDIVARNIPCLCISSNEQGLYFETLSRKNFSQMSDCNFVTRNKLDLNNIINDINLIENSPKNYQCYDLLKKYNDISNMPDIYADL